MDLIRRHRRALFATSRAGFTPAAIGKIVAWGDPTLEDSGSTPDLIAGDPAWTSLVPPSTTTVAGQKVLSFDGLTHRIHKDTSAIPVNLGAGFAAWCNLTAADATELLFDAGTSSIRVFRTSALSTATTFVRANGTFEGNATLQDFRFPNTALEGGWHFLYIGILGDESVCLVDGVSPAGLSTVSVSGTTHFPDVLGAPFSATTSIGSDTGGFNFAQLLLGQFYGLVGDPLTASEELSLRNFRSLAGA